MTLVITDSLSANLFPSSLGEKEAKNQASPIARLRGLTSSRTPGTPHCRPREFCQTIWEYADCHEPSVCSIRTRDAGE